MKDTKILLLPSPKSENNNIDRDVGACHDLKMMAHILKSLGYNKTECYTPLGNNVQKLEDKIASTNPEIILLDCDIFNRFKTFELAKYIKNRRMDTILIMIGSFANIMCKEILKKIPEVDIILRDELKFEIGELIDSILYNKSLKDIKGISYRDKQGKIVRNKEGEFVENIDNLHKKHSGFYRELSYVEKSCIFTARGCPKHCYFCNIPGYSNGRWRPRSANSIVDQIDFIVSRYGIRDIVVGDFNFTADRERIINICKALIKRKIKITWKGTTSIEFMSPEIIKWFKGTGCTQITYELESGSSSLLERINNKISLEQIYNIFHLTKRFGMKACLRTYVGHKGETEETIDECIKLIKIVRPDTLQVDLLKILPGSDLYLNLTKENKIDNKIWFYSTPQKFFPDYYFTPDLIPVYTIGSDYSTLSDYLNKILKIQQIQTSMEILDRLVTGN